MVLFPWHFGQQRCFRASLFPHFGISRALPLSSQTSEHLHRHWLSRTLLTDTRTERLEEGAAATETTTPRRSAPAAAATANAAATTGRRGSCAGATSALGLDAEFAAAAVATTGVDAESMARERMVAMEL